MRVACVASCILLAGAPARATDNPTPLARFEQPLSFHIAAGPLGSALLEFSRETQIQVIVSPTVSQVYVAGVDGHLSAREALAALLDATGLVYSVIGNTVTIHAALRERAPTPVQ